MAFKSTSIGFRLRKQRSLMGYTIRQAAKEVGIAPIRLSQWERNLRKPSIENLVKLAVLFRVMVDELCFGLRQDVAQTMEARFRKSDGGVLKDRKEKPP